MIDRIIYAIVIDTRNITFYNINISSFLKLMFIFVERGML